MSAPLQNLSLRLLKSASGKQAIGSWANKLTTALFSRSVARSVEETLRRIDQVLQNHQGAFMQPVQPALPIPPGLKAPVPKTPWNITSGLFARMPVKAEARRNTSFAVKSCPPILKPLLSSNTSCTLNLMAMPSEKFIASTTPIKPKALKEELKLSNKKPRNTALTPQRKNRSASNKIELESSSDGKPPQLIFHPSKSKAQKEPTNIPKSRCYPSGMEVLSKYATLFALRVSLPLENTTTLITPQDKDANASTDIGYFGSGIYFTNSARYAAMYAPMVHLLLSWVSMREPYPVVNDVPHPKRAVT